jgi:hypothetical protein
MAHDAWQGRLRSSTPQEERGLSKRIRVIDDRLRIVGASAIRKAKQGAPLSGMKRFERLIAGLPVILVIGLAAAMPDDFPWPAIPLVIIVCLMVVIKGQ